MGATAGYNASIAVGGTATSFSEEATAKVTADTVYRITDTSKRLLDPRETVTVEVDPERAAQAREALAGTPAVVLVGDWRELLPARGPFDLVFADGGVAYDLVADLLAPGGIVVKDDLTPGRATEGDATREALLLDDRLIATELLVTSEMAAIVAVRR